MIKAAKILKEILINNLDNMKNFKRYSNQLKK